MNLKKIYFFSFLSVAVLSQCSSSTFVPHQTIFLHADVDGYAYEWASQLPMLDDEEVILLANFLYFSLLLSHYESQVRLALLETTQVLALHKHLNNDYRLHTSAANAIKDLEELITDILPMRSYGKNAWEACLAEIEKSGHHRLKKIIFEFQKESYAIMSDAIMISSPEIDTYIHNKTQTFSSILRILQLNNGILQAVNDHAFPFDDQEESTKLAEIEHALSIVPGTYEALGDLALNTAQLEQLSIDMLFISTLIFKSYYSALYAMLSSYNSKLFLPVMFDEDGLIQPDKQNQYLPEM
jgi:hypothetical protein